MNIIFLSLGFAYGGRTDHLYCSLVRFFAQNNHYITVVAPAIDKSKIGLQIEDELRVIRVPTNELFNVGLIRKGIANVILPFQFKMAIKKYGELKQLDLVITATPPITLYSLVAWLKKKYKTKTYLILRDIFPQMRSI